MQTTADGELSDCLWSEDRKEGLGFVIYANGDTYKGEFRMNKKDGFGTLFSVSTQELYIGNWSNN